MRSRVRPGFPRSPGILEGSVLILPDTEKGNELTPGPVTGELEPSDYYGYANHRRIVRPRAVPVRDPV